MTRNSPFSSASARSIIRMDAKSVTAFTSAMISLSLGAVI